ncbi:hypothetical protein D3C72_1210260 [compost metagenome]
MAEISFSSSFTGLRKRLFAFICSTILDSQSAAFSESPENMGAAGALWSSFWGPHAARVNAAKPKINRKALEFLMVTEICRPRASSIIDSFELVEWWCRECQNTLTVCGSLGRRGVRVVFPAGPVRRFYIRP